MDGLDTFHINKELVYLVGENMFLSLTENIAKRLLNVIHKKLSSEPQVKFDFSCTGYECGPNYKLRSNQSEGARNIDLGTNR